MSSIFTAFLETFLAPFFPAELKPFLFREGDLILQVPFGSHIVFEFGLFLRRKGSDFSRFKQETEELAFESGGPVGEVFHVVEGVAYLLEDGRFGGKDAAVGQFQEDELEPVGHAFEGFPFAQVVPEEDTVGALVDGEVQDADEVYGREIVSPFPGGHLLLDGKSGIEQRPLIEEVLMGELHLHHKPRSIDVGTFHVHADSLVVGERIRMLLRSVFQVGDSPFGNQRFEEELEELLSPFGSEGSFEPIIEQDSRIASG